MDLDDVSISSIEDEQCNKGTSSMKSESGNEGIHVPISINKTSTQSNNKRLQKYDDTGYSAEVTKRSRSKVQNEILKVQDGGSSVCTIGKSSTSNTSSMVGNEILKTSQSMLSFTSTDATCGSSSSNSISSEDELLDDLEEISKRCETEDVSDLEQPILGLPRRAVGNLSNPPSTASFSGIDVGSESQTTDCGFAVADRSSLPEDSNSLKSPEMCSSLDAVDLPSLPKGRLSNHFKSDEFPSKFCFSSTLASDKPSGIEELSSNKNAITVPRLLGKAPPLNIREDETSMIPDSGAIGGFHDYDCNRQNYCQKEDKSVRRKVRREPPTSSNSLPNRSSPPSATSSPKKVGRSLLKICKSLEKTSHEEDDWDINETYSRSGEMEHFTPNSWAQELISFCYRTQNADTTPRLDTESILKEVRHFFQNNHVEADENLSWKQNKFRILTSKYFSDEFSRSHGLLSNEELLTERLKDLECYSSPYARNQMELFELCVTLMECSVSEETFIDYFKIRIRDGGCDIFDPSNRAHRNDNVNRRLFSIEKEIGFHVMLELYKKLAREGASYRSILYESSMPSAAEERFRCRELRSVSESSSQVPCEFSAGNQSTIHTDFQPLNPTLSQNESDNIDSPSSNEANMPQNEESPAESFQTDSRESKDDSNALDSSVTAENEPCNAKTSLLATEMLESGNEHGAGENGSNVSAADLD